MDRNPNTLFPKLPLDRGYEEYIPRAFHSGHKQSSLLGGFLNSGQTARRGRMCFEYSIKSKFKCICRWFTLVWVCCLIYAGDIANHSKGSSKYPSTLCALCTLSPNRAVTHKHNSNSKHARTLVDQRTQTERERESVYIWCSTHATHSHSCNAIRAYSTHMYKHTKL